MSVAASTSSTCSRRRSLLEQAQQFCSEVAHRGGTVLFVGTKKQARDSVKEVAESAGMPYVHHRWLGGLLTNFQTISLRIKRLHDLERYAAEGQLALLPTRERMAAQADLAKLQANLGGVKNMQRPPDAMFVVDLKTEVIAVQEAKRLRIPIIGLVDTNCDPDGIDYVIPGNDDAIKSCAIITQAIGDVVSQGYQTFRAEEERARKEAEEQARKEAEARAAREEEERQRKEAEEAAARQAERDAQEAAAAAAAAPAEAAAPRPPDAAPAEAAPRLPAAEAAPAEAAAPAAEAAPPRPRLRPPPRRPSRPPRPQPPRAAATPGAEAEVAEACRPRRRRPRAPPPRRSRGGRRRPPSAAGRGTADAEAPRGDGQRPRRPRAQAARPRPAPDARRQNEKARSQAAGQEDREEGRAEDGDGEGMSTTRRSPRRRSRSCATSPARA